MPPDRFAVNGLVGVGLIVELQFTNPSLASTTVDVVVTDYSGHSTTLPFVLNAQGVGKVNWEIPSWDLFVLQHSTSQDHATVIP